MSDLITTREILLNKTITSLKHLPDDELKEIADFTEYLLQKHEDRLIKRSIAHLISDSVGYQFLNEEEELYFVSDIKESYQ